MLNNDLLSNNNIFKLCFISKYVKKLIMLKYDRQNEIKIQGNAYIFLTSLLWCDIVSSFLQISLKTVSIAKIYFS